MSRELVAEVQGEGLQGTRLAGEVLDRSVPLLRRMLGDLADVPAPAALEQDYEAWVRRLRGSLPLYEQLADAVRRNQGDPGLQAKLEDLAKDTRPFAFEHGLKACLPDQS